MEVKRYSKEHFSELVKKHLHGTTRDDETIEQALDEFFTEDYTFILLENDGFIGFTEREDCIAWYFFYDGGLFGNRKKATKLAKNMQKPIIYSGKTDKYHNNSIKLDNDVYQLMV